MLKKIQKVCTETTSNLQYCLHACLMNVLFNSNMKTPCLQPQGVLFPCSISGNGPAIPCCPDAGFSSQCPAVEYIQFQLRSSTPQHLRAVIPIIKVGNYPFHYVSLFVPNVMYGTLKLFNLMHNYYEISNAEKMKKRKMKLIFLFFFQRTHSGSSFFLLF